MSSQPAPPTAGGSQARLVTIVDSEIAELSQFIATQSGRDASNVASHLRWFLLENPARNSETPLGCGLRSSAGELVGCILCVPQTFRYGSQSFTIMGSSSFYVDERYRGSGGLLFLRFSEFCRTWAMFGNSANADAARLWKARGATAIPFSDHELFGVVRWRPVIEEMLHRGGMGAISRSLAALSSGIVGVLKRLNLDVGDRGRMVALTSAEKVLELPIQMAPAHMTSDRNEKYIHWRYFSSGDPTVAVYRFQQEQMGTAVLVTVNQRRRGYRQHINTLNLLDVYPAVNPDVYKAIVSALWGRYRDAVDAIVLRGLGQEHQEALMRKGFVRRQFEAPNGWLLDKAKFLPTRDLYTVPADGDWLI